MKITYKTKTPEETIELGMQLTAHLQPGFAVLLFGDLGSGKTHFTKGIAKGLGISGLIKSPTFTYVNQYELQNNIHFYHYDLYRLNPGDEFYSIGLEDTLNNPHAINVIEWADRLAGMHPKAFIRIDFHSFMDHHEIEFHFEDPQIVPNTLVEQYWQQWSTPMHVRAHSKQVASVALQIAEALAQKNILINFNLLNTAALLHDMTRVSDFKSLDRDKFHEVITDEKWNKWKAQRAQYQGMHHADIACGALMEDGYNKTAELIRLHQSLAIITEPEKFSFLEIALLYYADKRVKHDEIVDLKERFRDGRQRHGKEDSPERRQQYQQVEAACFELEQKLFDLTDLQPEDIH